MKKKKGHDEEHENSERWLLTYADMITLLMAFFIMMYSMSVLNIEKFREVAISIRSGFGGMMDGNGKHLLHESGKSMFESKMSIAPQNKVRDLQQDVQSYAILENLSKELQAQWDERGLVISVATDGLLFARGTAELRPEAIHILEHLTGQFKSLPHALQIEGHTCTLPINTAQFPSNWELSAARAIRVVRFLEQQGIAGTRLSGVGYGATHPRASNDTEAQRTRNRRVEIVILNSKAGMMPATTPAAAPPGTREPTAPTARPVIDKVWSTAVIGGG